MKLERRLRQLEKRQDATDNKREYLALEHMALRAAFIEFAVLISTSSAAQFAAAKHRAMHTLTDQLMAGNFSESATQEATEALEELFYEISAAHIALDQPIPPAS